MTLLFGTNGNKDEGLFGKLIKHLFEFIFYRFSTCLLKYKKYFVKIYFNFDLGKAAKIIQKSRICLGKLMGQFK